MKTFPAVVLSIGVSVSSLIGGVVIVDLLLPAQVIRTQVIHSQVGDAARGEGDRIHFIVPLTAGEVASCEVASGRRAALHSGLPIRVRRTWMLERCLAIDTAGRATGLPVGTGAAR